ncbi:MAG: hypothetical protein JST00_15690 [Deltaproteobacteria bacterium]|nr:hypothetical protein [Deltaproteobacteria bacterium]
MSNLDTHENGELWRVQMPSGAIRTLTLDELDEAFQAGSITESTPVLPPGAAAWTKLGDAAGLGDGPAEAPAPEMMPSLAPIAVSVAPAPPSVSLDALSALDDLDLDSADAYSFKKKGSKKTPVFIGIGLAVLLVGGIGFAASRAAKSVDFDAKSSLGAQPAKAAAATPPPAAEDPNPTPGRVLTEEQKAKLAEADRARAAREDQKRKDRPAPAPKRGPQPKSGTPFSNGGNKYDPLNGAL